MTPFLGLRLVGRRRDGSYGPIKGPSRTTSTRTWHQSNQDSSASRWLWVPGRFECGVTVLATETRLADPPHGKRKSVNSRC